MLGISAVSSARRSWVRFPTGVCVFSPEPVSSRYSGSPAIRNMYMIRFDLFYFHVMHMSVLKQKILPFPRSLQKASLPWSTTRVFVIIPPEDISVSGGHFSKTYNPVCPRETIRALAGKTNQKTKLILNSTIALVQYRGNFEQVTEPQTSPDEHLVWQLPQSLHESRECVVLQPLSIPKPKHLTFKSDVSRFPTLTLWHVDAQR